MMRMSTDTTTLMGRTEERGKPFPLWVERLLLVGAAVIFVLYREAVSGIVDHAVLGSLVAYAVFPLTLLAFVEILGRVLQGSLRS